MGAVKNAFGTPENGGYTKLDALTPEQKTFLDQQLSQAGINTQQAAAGYQSFLPGGQGNQPIINAANQNFQQQTLPSILNAYGTGSKGSSSLNQALAAGAANLNTNLGAQLAQNQLTAAQGMSGLGLGQTQASLGTAGFAYSPTAKPFWQEAALAGTEAAGRIIGSKV